MFARVLVVVLCGTCIAEEGRSFKAHVEAMQTKATAELKRAKEDLVLAKKARVNAAYRGPQRTEKGFVLKNGDEKRMAIAYFESEILHWEKALRGEFVPLPDELSPGQIGIITNEENLVSQVVSNTAAIIDANSPGARIAKRRPNVDAPTGPLVRDSQDAFSAFQRARENAIAPQYLTSRVIWVETSTAGMVDGASVKITKPVVITGTKQYGTVAGGTKTLLHARTLTEDEIAEYRKVMTAKPKPSP